jgi:hypothetical protein
MKFASLFALACMLFVASQTQVAAVRAEDKVVAEKIDLGEGKYSMVAPIEWRKVQPRSKIVQAEFRAPRDLKDDEAARVTVMQAGGDIQANIDRWIGQFDEAKKEDAKVEKKEIAGQTVHIVDISGTYKESMGGGPFAPGPTKKLPNYRMLGAIVVTKDAGTTFIKMTGPKDIVEKLAESFRKSVEELKAN